MEQTTTQQQNRPNALALAEQAAAQWQNGQWEAGAESLFYVAQIAVAEKEFAYAGQMYMQIGQALTRVPTRITESRNAFYQAGLCYRESGDSRNLAASIQQLAALELTEGRAENGVAMLEAATSLVTDDVEMVVQLRALQAHYQAMAGDASAAVTTLTEALTLTTDPKTRQSLEQLQQWYRLADQQDLPAGQLAQMVRQTQQKGLGQQFFDRRLLHAYELLATGKVKQTIREVMTVRKQAAAASDPMRGLRHFQASILLALAREQQNDRVGVLGAMLTCRAFLADVYGEAQAQNVDALLDGFAQRWGADEMAMIVTEYEEQRADKGK